MKSALFCLSTLALCATLFAQQPSETREALEPLGQPVASEPETKTHNGSWRTRPVSPEMVARYEARLTQRVIETLGFLLITWLPLQIGAILMVKHPLARIGAGLAILPMVPILITASQTKTYRDGSLFGIFLMGVYGPVMVYLAVFLVMGLVMRAARAKCQTPGSTPASKAATPFPPSEKE